MTSVKAGCWYTVITTQFYVFVYVIRTATAAVATTTTITTTTTTTASHKSNPSAVTQGYMHSSKAVTGV